MTPIEPALAARAVTKRFPGVVAVDGVDFDVFPREIVALLGANGAGKSTLIQVLAGVHPWGSYEGQVRLGGAEYRPRSVAEAEAAGVALVPQEIHVVPQLSVAANLYLHSQPKRLMLIDHQRLFADARRALLGFGLDLDVRAPMGTLDLATQQLVIIVRALSKNARVLILDEPTAALTDDEAQRLFEKLRALRERGVGIVFVSHRLAEVFSISDRIVAMRFSGERRARALGVAAGLHCREVSGTRLGHDGLLGWKNRPSIRCGACDGRPKIHYLRRGCQMHSRHGAVHRATPDPPSSSLTWLRWPTAAILLPCRSKPS